MRREAKILNLCGELSSDIQQYFESRGLMIVDPRQDEHAYRWTHILTQDLNDFNFIRDTYQTLEEDIQIISLTPIKDKQNFVLANGKLCLETEGLESDLKSFLLDKYFQDYLDPSVMSDNSIFNELGHFSLNQFFSFGDHVDRLTKVSYASGVSGVAVRTYLDHLIMYMAALKNGSKMELPAEIGYGDSSEAFGLQIYFSAQNLMMEDVSACLSLHHSRRAEETLLATALSTCDFFDLSLVANAQKVSITALWLKNTEVENPGFMLSWLPQKAKIVSYMKDDVQAEIQTMIDPVQKIEIPALVKENEDIREVSKDSFSEIVSTRISEKVEIEKVKKIVQKDLTDEEILHLLEESAEEENKVVLGSYEELEEALDKITEIFEDLEVYKKDFFKGDELVDEVIDSLRKNHSDLMKVKSLREHLPNQIKQSLNQFCQEKMLTNNNLTREHIKEFQVHFLKKCLKKDTVVLNSQGKELIKDLKTRLERKLKTEFQADDVTEVFEQAKSNDSDRIRVKSIFKDSLKDSLEAKFEFSRNGVITKEQEKIIVKSLSSSLEEAKETIEEIITNEEGVKPHRPLFSASISEKEKALLVKLEALQQEKKGLSDKLQASILEIKALKEAKSAVSSINSKALEVSTKETQQDHFDENAVVKKEIQERLAAGTLSAADQKKLSELMEKELTLMTAVREEVMKYKKLHIESSQKEAMFTSELAKLTRQLKARDLILNKSKENMSKIAEKKDAEIEALKNKLDQAQVDLKQENSNMHALENRHLHIQNMNLTKQLEVYKSKLNQLSLNLKNKENNTSSREDLRKLQIEKVQLQNELSKHQKDLQRANSMLEREVSQTKALREEMLALREQLKVLESQPKIVKEVGSAKEKQLQTGPSENEVAQMAKIKSLETQVTDLEMRLAETLKNQRAGTQDEKKMLHLESNLKKVTQDLLEARNQTNEFKKENNKLRQEKTALQNQLERMKKESQKAKKAA